MSFQIEKDKNKDTFIDITKEKINLMINKDKNKRNLRRKEDTEKYRNYKWSDCDKWNLSFPVLMIYNKIKH